MYGNIGALAAFSTLPLKTAIAFTGTSDVVLDVPGADPNQDVVSAVSIQNPDAALNGTVVTLMNVWVSAPGKVSLRYNNPGESTDIFNAGTVFVGLLARCENQGFPPIDCL